MLSLLQEQAVPKVAVLPWCARYVDRLMRGHWSCESW